MRRGLERAKQAGRRGGRAVDSARAAYLRARTRRLPAGSLVRVDGHEIRVNDGPNLAVLYEDIFRRGIYRFESRRSHPYILDCGANIGMSALYFKRLYPGARILAFEPDPVVFPYLTENIERNHLRDVEGVHAAVGAHDGNLQFWSDGKYEARLADYHYPKPGRNWQQVEVPTRALAAYLDNEVDFLKMNVEGAEWEILEAAGAALRAVAELVLEYHHLPGLPRTLHRILGLFDELGFEYVVSDFGLSTYSPSRPPVDLSQDSRYYRHVYARRLE